MRTTGEDCPDTVTHDNRNEVGKEKCDEIVSTDSRNRVSTGKWFKRD